MGAYGSPDLNNQSQYQSPYQQTYQQYPKQKGHGCLVAVVVVLSIVVVFCVLALIGKNVSNRSDNFNNSALPAAAPVYSVPAIPSAPAVASTPNISEEFLKMWTETALASCLYYPSTAKYSDNPSDWNFTFQGNLYTVSSYLTTKNQNGSIGKGNFVVKIAYNDLKAEITYISISGRVLYDINKTTSK